MQMKRILKTTLTIAFILIAALIILFFMREYLSNYFVRSKLDDIVLPGKNDHVLVFAPHNDDEVLGAGELIGKTIKNGASVKVVMMTNGDGFKNAVQLDYFKLNPQPFDYIKFGYQRQNETTAALNMLGLSSKNIVFLGYPDRELSVLWSSHWDNSDPYISAYTQVSRSPYYNSFTKGAPYAGADLVRDITTIIKDFQPTHIVMPHPNDKHPDHWATNCFVKYALTALDYHPVKEWLYLVHRGDWPTPPKENINMYLVPPAKLIGTGTDWQALDLSDQEIREKITAIHLYKTQINILRLLMIAFERKNELFGEYPNVRISRLDRADNTIAPDNNNRVIIDPLQDALNLEISRETDIIGVYTELSKNNNLHVFIKTDGKIGKLPKYYLNMILFYDQKIARLSLADVDNKITLKHESALSIDNSSGIVSDTKGQYLHIMIPGNIIGEPNHIYINAMSSISGYRMDKTAWRMLDK